MLCLQRSECFEFLKIKRNNKENLLIRTQWWLEQVWTTHCNWTESVFTERCLWFSLTILAASHFHIAATSEYSSNKQSRKTTVGGIMIKRTFFTPHREASAGEIYRRWCWNEKKNISNTRWPWKFFMIRFTSVKTINHEKVTLKLRCSELTKYLRTIYQTAFPVCLCDAICIDVKVEEEDKSSKKSILVIIRASESPSRNTVRRKKNALLEHPRIFWKGFPCEILNTFQGPGPNIADFNWIIEHTNTPLNDSHWVSGRSVCLRGERVDTDEDTAGRLSDVRVESISRVLVQLIDLWEFSLFAFFCFTI